MHVLLDLFHWHMDILCSTLLLGPGDVSGLPVFLAVPSFLWQTQNLLFCFQVAAHQLAVFEKKAVNDYGKTIEIATLIQTTKQPATRGRGTPLQLPLIIVQQVATHKK